MSIDDIARRIKQKVIMTKFGKTLTSQCEYGFANIKGTISARQLAVNMFGLSNTREVNIAIALLTSKEFATPLPDEVIVLGDDTRAYYDKYTVNDYTGVTYVIYGRMLSDVISSGGKKRITHYSGNNNDSLFVTTINKKQYVHFARFIVPKSTNRLWEYIKSQLDYNTVKEIEHIECKPYLETYPRYNGEYHEIRK